MKLTVNEIQSFGFSGTLSRNRTPFMQKTFYSIEGLDIGSLTLSTDDIGSEKFWFTNTFGLINIEGLKQISSKEELNELIDKINIQLSKK